MERLFILRPVYGGGRGLEEDGRAGASRARRMRKQRGTQLGERRRTRSPETYSIHLRMFYILLILP